MNNGFARAVGSRVSARATRAAWIPLPLAMLTPVVVPLPSLAASRPTQFYSNPCFQTIERDTLTSNSISTQNKNQ